MATRQADTSGSDDGKKRPRRSKQGGDDGGDGGDDAIPPTDASLVEEAKRRYLNYAVSVITSRALPDVRDGLKPVQRRILYSMFQNLHLYPDARFKKCATIVGDVLGKYHPHGDTAAYDALVRMAQDFSFRMPLVEGHGNFGSLDGDAAAAYRYTEARLQKLAMELLVELREGTVDFRPNYDGSQQEPIILPARVPQMLINGCAGIAVGMATNIPPHNMKEVCEAAIALSKDRELQTKDLMKFVKGPDFPTGGLVTNTKAELRDIYETGQGSIKLRGEWKTEETKRGTTQIIITSIPYNVTKSTLVERIAEIIIDKKLPMLVDVRDESTAIVRIVLETKPEADPALVMSYLFKHTPMESGFHVNMTCLVPTENRDVAGPMRINLRLILGEFLDFREEVVRRRFQFELAALEKRIHLLEGFKIVFNVLDETIRIIRKSDGKADAAEKLMARFPLDAEQTEAILELKLYKLAKLEINIILEELAEKRKRAKEIRGILESDRKLWNVIREELTKAAQDYADPRRTKIGGGGGDDVEFDAEAFIVDEEVTVVLTRDGWLKRVREIKDIGTTRVREGDAVLGVYRGSTKEPIAIFSNQGSCYVMRINDVPASTGYGEPVQKLFKFRDGERVVAAQIMSDRLVKKGQRALAITKAGYGLRFDLEPHREFSTRAGRKFARVADDDEFVGILPVDDGDVIVAVTRDSYMMLCKADEVTELQGPGRGVRVIKVADDDELFGFALGREKDKKIVMVETDSGKTISVGPAYYEIVGRGGRGRRLKSNVKVTRMTPVTGNAADPKLIH